MCIINASQAKALIKTQLAPKENQDLRERAARLANSVELFKTVAVNTSSNFMAKEKGDKD